MYKINKASSKEHISESNSKIPSQSDFVSDDQDANREISSEISQQISNANSNDNPSSNDESSSQEQQEELLNKASSNRIELQPSNENIETKKGTISTTAIIVPDPESTSEEDNDIINANTYPKTDTETATTSTKSPQSLDDSGANTFKTELFRLNRKFLDSSFHTFPIIKKETKKLGKMVNGELTLSRSNDRSNLRQQSSNDSHRNRLSNSSGSGSIRSGYRSGRPRLSSAVSHPLEEYIRTQEEAYLDSEQSLYNDEYTTETTNADENPLILQGIDPNWPKNTSHNNKAMRKEFEVIYSVNKSAITLELDQMDNSPSPSVQNSEILWPPLDESRSPSAISNSSAGAGGTGKKDVIAAFVHPDAEIREYSDLIRPNSVRPRLSTLHLDSSDTINYRTDVIQQTGEARVLERIAQSTDSKQFNEELQILKEFLMDTIIINREAIDLFTFPLSHDYESFGRIKGMFYLLSQTGRIIKLIDNQQQILDVTSATNFVLKELELLHGIVLQFVEDSIQMIQTIKKAGLTRLKKFLNIINKLLKKVSSGEHEFNDTSSIPIYSTKLEPMTITWYEKFIGATYIDYNATSIELLWTPTLTFFKGFKEKNWYCLQVENPLLQVKMILGTVKLIRKIFLEVKYILQEETESIENHVSQSVDKMYTILKQIKKNGHDQRTLDFLLLSREKIQELYDLHNTMISYLNTLEDGFNWVKSVLPNINQLAGLRNEDVEELLERQKHARLFSKCFNFIGKCQQIIHPFLLNKFKFMLLRLPLQNDIMYRLLQEIQDRVPWNVHAKNVLQIMCEAQIYQFKDKQNKEEKEINNIKDDGTKINRDRSGSRSHMKVISNHRLQNDEKSISLKSPLTVYNAGHVYVHVKA